MKKFLITKLEGDHPDGSIRVMSDRISLAEGRGRSVETLTRVFRHPADHFYGELEITKAMLQEMVRNFDAGVYGQKIYVNQAHMDSQGAAGEITRIFLEGNKLRGEIEWTDYGLELIHKRGFRYFSAEFLERYEDPEKETKHGAVLLGAAITIRPRVKRMDPINPEKIALSENPSDTPYIVLPNVKKMLSEEITAMWKELIKELQEQLKKAKNLSEENVTKLTDGFKGAVEYVTEEAAAKALQKTFLDMGTQLAESGDGDKVINLTINAPQPGQKNLTADDVNRLVAEGMQKLTEDNAAAAKKLAEDLQGNIQIFNAAIDASEGLKSLSEEALGNIRSASDLITAEMTEEQVRKLAEHQIKLGNDLAVAAALSARGYVGPAGNIHITLDESNAIKKLQETVDKRLGYADMPDGERYERTGGQLSIKHKKLTENVLRLFDAERGRQLHDEAKMLASGTGTISDTAVPVIVERTVIREMLYQLSALNFVDVGTYPFGNSANIPYSYRDTAAAGKSSTRVYEGQAIQRAGVIQTTEEARPIPQKIAFLVSDEMRYLTSASVLNWETVAENTRNAVRVIGEDTEQVLMNEILLSTLEESAVAVTNENLELQADGSDKVFILANFPVVRPRKIYDLKGSQVGSTVNPITVTYNSVARAEYDGTGTQAAGTYYVLDYDLGEIYLVDESGAIQIPADTVAYTISYSYATNVYNFSTDIGSLAVEKHWNTFLYRYGLRKALIKSQRFHRADLGIMSDTYKTAIEQADTFGANFSRPGTDLNMDGDLGKIKGIPNFSTTAPGLHIGDRYCIIGERNTTRFRMMKAWQMGELQDARDSNGKFTGQKEAYGDQFIVAHTPTQLKRATTAILTYSATARVARATP